MKPGPSTIAVLPLVLCSFAFSSARAQLTSTNIPPDGPDQMLVLYTHGFNDDGAAWGMGDLSGEAGSIPNLSTYQARYQTNEDAGIRLFSDQGITSYAVQWSVASPGLFPDPYATAASGFAFLADQDLMRTETDWVGGTLALHARARPGFMEVLQTPDMDRLLPIYAPFEAALTASWFPFPLPGSVQQAGRKTFYLGLAANVNNYNDSGRVEDHSTDLLDLLRNEREPGRPLAKYRQINIITHSKGSLVTRAMLHKAEAASREDGEYVANVIYNAPPFAGCSLTELLKLMYDPIVVTRADLANPWLAQTIDEIKDGLTGETSEIPNPRFGDLVRAWLQALGDPFGADLSVIENQVPTVKNQLDLLNVFEIEAFTLQSMATAPAHSPPADAGELVVGIMNAVRPVVTSAIGIPSFPTAREDLTPQGGVDFIQNYSNSSNAFQVVNLGTAAPYTHVLWPTAGMAAVASNPSLLTDPSIQSGQVSDTYVARQSAELLTTTDNFGPRYTLGGYYPTDHGGITLRFDLMASNWFSIFLAPPTSLQLNGTIDVVSSEQRIYAVSTDTTFSFSSSNFTASVEGDELDIEAAHHQYRFLPRYAADPEPTPWEQLNPGNSRTFGDALAAHGLQDSTVEMQWRAVNLAGGREMIRSATIVPVGDPPMVVDTDMIGLGNEIVQRDRRRLGGRVTRPTFFTSLTNRLADLAVITSTPEADWLIRNQAGKALVAVFGKRGSVDFAWNDPTLSSATTRSNVNALFLTLETLSEGMNTLTFQPFIEVLGIERRGPIQTIRVFVDNVPPEHSFTGLEFDAIGWRVGPGTLLQYRAEDLESGGAQGTLSVFGFTNTTFAAGDTFRLGETDLAAQIKAAGGSNLVGGFITFVATATDRVGNLTSNNFQAYFDFTAPTLTNLTVVGSLPTPVGVQVFTNTVLLKVDVREPNTSAFLPPCAAYQNLQGGEAACSQPFGFEQTVGVYARYTNTVALFPGSNLVQIVCRDVYGNIASLPLLIEYAQPPASDNGSITLLTPRIDNENSLYFNEAGNPTNFTLGAISSVAVSRTADRFLFSSSGNGFVYGDNNGLMDVFLTEGGRITRVNTGAQGQQALGGASASCAISGNGRYAFFSSAATNLVAGTSNDNLYVKDLGSGEIGVISRHYDGHPINRLSALFEAAPTFNGRYVFFSCRNASFVNGLTDGNTGRDIYMVDLDPDANGSFFDDNYVTVAISTVNPTQTGNGESRTPTVSGDGRYLLFICQATDIAADLALNGITRDALLIKFAGNANDGTLDVSSRSMYVVNRSAVAGGGTTATGVEAASLAPDGDTVLFATRSNIEFSGDSNSESTGMDIYSSFGETFGTSGISSRVSAWQSRGVGGAQSSVPIIAPPARLIVSEDRRPLPFFSNKISWVTPHSNLVSGDANGVNDVFIGSAGGLGVSTMDPPVPNWISGSIISAQTVADGGLTPDGRSAWWVTTQTYTSPYGAGRQHLYLRRLDPPTTNTVTVNITGQGTVTQTPVGSSVSSNVTAHVDVEDVALLASPDSGWRFVSWAGVDTPNGPSALVSLISNRTVTAAFGAAAPPSVTQLNIALLEDTPSAPFAPTISDADPNDAHTLSVVTPPLHGQVTVGSDGFTYEPELNYAGADDFEFQVTDRYGLTLTSPATANLQINPVNDPPVVQSVATVALGPGQQGPILPAVSDPDEGETITFSIVLQAANGTASADANGLYYVPAAGFSGIDSFTFRATDAADASDTGTVQMDVRSDTLINDANVSAGQFMFTVGALPEGVGYTVEYKEQINDPTWQPVPPPDQWPSTNVTFNDESGQQQRYYRLKFEFLPQ